MTFSVAVILAPPCEATSSVVRTRSSWYRFILELSHSWEKVNIVCPPLNSSDSCFALPVRNAELRQTPLFQFDSFLSYYSSLVKNFFPTIASYIKSIKESDIVIFRIPCPGYCLVSALCIMLNKPVVAFVSGNIKTQSDTFNSSHGIKKIFLSFLLVARVRLHRFFLEKTEHSFHVSTDVLQLYCLSKNRHASILRTPIFSSAQITNTVKTNLYSPGSPLKIIRACWLQPSKGLENLLIAVSELRKTTPVTLDIYGEAKNRSYQEMLEGLVLRLNLTENVNFLGWVTQDELQAIYSKYHLHVMSSISEGMPRVCLEASVNRLPQVMTPVGGICDFYEHMVDSFITRDYSPESLLIGIQWFLDNPEIATMQAEKANQRALKSSLEASAERVNDILKLSLLS